MSLLDFYLHFSSLFVVLIPIALLWAALLGTMRRLKREKRFDAGECVACGYDLRESPERCPECGRPVSAEIEPDAPLVTPMKVRIPFPGEVLEVVHTCDPFEGRAFAERLIHSGIHCHAETRSRGGTALSVYTNDVSLAKALIEAYRKRVTDRRQARAEVI